MAHMQSNTDTESTARFAALLARIEAAKAEKPLDLSAAEDLTLAVMNLISLEEHFFFTGAKTGDASYYDVSGEVRELRTELMARLIPKEKHVGETWCAAKHLLAASMRLIEVGGKYRKEKDAAASERVFAAAYRLYSLFWALKLQLLDARRAAREAKNAKKESALTLEDLITRLANCCDE